MSPATLKNNNEFTHIINDFFGSKYATSSPENDIWNQSNVIIVETQGDKYLRQTRYYPYDINSSRKLDQKDWEYIVRKQSNILLIHEDGSYDVINSK